MMPKPSKYPKKIYFGMETYKIKWVKNLDCYGEADPSRKEIRIKKGMSNRNTFITLIHELLHVMEAEHSIKLKHKVVYKLERAIFELLYDNFL